MKAMTVQCVTDPKRVARRVNLRYVTDREPGISRRRRGSGFVYECSPGQPVRDPATLRRIEQLVIPPAWRDVWVCRHATGHLQATGRDAAGRKQYLYHERWSRISSQTKYDHLLAFAEALPTLRRAVDRDMRRAALDQKRVVAGMVRLMDLTLIRVGNDEYAKQNDSYGLTTLRDRHVRFGNGRAVVSFNGKSGQHQEREVHDPRLVRLIRRCHDLPGYRLFQYVDESGVRRTVGSGDVNDYIREASGCADLSAKDFRTWGGTVWGAVILAEMGPGTSARRCDAHICAAIKRVAQHLGNRPAVCRKYYLHPAVLDAYRSGELFEAMRVRQEERGQAPRTGLSPQEQAVKELIAKAGRTAGKAA